MPWSMSSMKKWSGPKMSRYSPSACSARFVSPCRKYWEISPPMQALVQISPSRYWRMISLSILGL